MGSTIRLPIDTVEEVSRRVELTILMPCLNEALTVGKCIDKARTYLSHRDIVGEILIADNGSTDGSQLIARAAGATVINITAKGYGSALIGGIQAARGQYILMGDADDSYDFENLDGFIEKLRSGFELVMGNRFKGEIRPGAMPLLNRYFGNPLLSLIGRTLFASDIGDFHCGIRGFDRAAIVRLGLRSSGMEFASEMVVKASLAGLRIDEVPTTLSPDGRQRAPHLRPWRDGFRHLTFMLLRSPHYLFLYPGLLITAVGLVGTSALTISPIHIPGVMTLDVNSLLYFAFASLVGIQISYFGLCAISLATRVHLRQARGLPQVLVKLGSSGLAVAVGLGMLIAGSIGAIYAVEQWGHASFGALIPSEVMRITIPAVTTLAIGVQVVFGGLLLGFIELD